MTQKQETKLSQECMKWVRDNGGKVIKIYGNEYMEAGTPDHLGSIEVGGIHRFGISSFDSVWIHFFIELKNPGEWPTKIQEKRLEEWAAVGFKTGVAHSLDEYKEIILG